MKVMKFGGTSVGTADNIKRVIDIIRSAAAEGPCAVVLSAMQGTTDQLINAGRIAERGDDGYIEIISNIREKHTETIQALFSQEPNPRILDFVEATIHELESLCEGVRL